MASISAVALSDVEFKDGVVYIDGKVAETEDQPLRTDLPKTHPLYGTRALCVVPSGYRDCTIGSHGELTQIDDDDPVDIDPVDLDPVAIPRGIP